MFIQNINPDLITLGPFSIRFYGIVYALGFLFVSYLLEKKVGKIKNLTKDGSFDLMAFTMLFALLGARIVHVLSEFYLYKDNLWNVFAFWHGGLAFHGGLIGGILAMYFYCKKHKINMLEILDSIALPLPLVTFFGRIANFINSEHLGFSTNVPWCVVFQRVDGICRHPVQIYEAITQLIIFLILFFIGKKRRKDGFIAWLYLILYGIFRILTEFYREQSAVYIIGFTGGQALSVLMILIGIWMIRKDNQGKKR